MKPGELGRKLALLRAEHDLRQIEVVRFVNRKYGTKITPGSYSKWENGREEPSRVRDVAALAQFYNVNLDWLIGLSDEKYNKEQTEKFYRVPILTNFVPGVSIPVQKDIIGYEIINGEQMSERIDFCFKMNENSMEGACIFEGDILFIHGQAHIESGEIALVVIKKKTIVKRVYRAGKALILHSENPNHADIVLSGKELKNLHIAGKVICVKGKVR